MRTVGLQTICIHHALSEETAALNTWKREKWNKQMNRGEQKMCVPDLGIRFRRLGGEDCTAQQRTTEDSGQ